MATTDLTDSALFAQIRDSLTGKPEEVPEGWSCSEQLAQIHNVGRSRMNEILATSVKQGIIERRVFRVLRGDHLRPVPYYRAVNR